MKGNLANVRALLNKNLAGEVRLEERSDGVLMLDTPFVFPDGDNYSIYFSIEENGDFLLSDKGNTIMHLSYKYDVDSIFNDENQYAIMLQIAKNAHIEMDEGAGNFWVKTDAKSLPETIFRFGQALTKIYDLSFISRYESAVKDAKLEARDERSKPLSQTEFDSAIQLTLHETLGPQKFTRNFSPEFGPIFSPQTPHGKYTVDYKFDGKRDIPVFLYGINSPSKAKDVTISLGYFHRASLKFNNLVVLRSEDCIKAPERERLLDAGAENIFLLENKPALERKILNMAA